MRQRINYQRVISRNSFEFLANCAKHAQGSRGKKREYIHHNLRWQVDERVPQVCICLHHVRVLSYDDVLPF